jgi:hypothetical protein
VWHKLGIHVQEFGCFADVLFVYNQVDDFEVADAIVLVLRCVASEEVCTYYVVLAHHFLERFRNFAL